MGVSHSMDDSQVQRVSTALQSSANAIQGINGKFDMIDSHWQQMQEFNEGINAKVDGTLDSVRRLDETLTGHADLALNAVVAAADGLTEVLEETLQVMQRFDMGREMDRMPKVIMPLAIPLILLLIELAVANAYLGILLSSLPNIRVKYSNYLLVNAGAILLGLTLSLTWLGLYRALLAYKTRRNSWSRRAPAKAEPRASARAAPPAEPRRQELAAKEGEEGKQQQRQEEEEEEEGLERFVASWEVLPPMARTVSAPPAICVREAQSGGDSLVRDLTDFDQGGAQPGPPRAAAKKEREKEERRPGRKRGNEASLAEPVAVEELRPSAKKCIDISLDDPLTFKVMWNTGAAKGELDSEDVTL